MPDNQQPTAGELRWRMDDHERRLQKVETNTEDIAVLKERLDTLADKVRALTTALWSVAVSLVVLTVSVLIAAGRFG
jgi:hypothetical protein